MKSWSAVVAPVSSMSFPAVLMKLEPLVKSLPSMKDSHGPGVAAFALRSIDLIQLFSFIRGGLYLCGLRTVGVNNSSAFFGVIPHKVQ
jgi:hypothetical protein